MKKVLVVDDMAFIRMTIRKILENNGYEVIGEADNGIEGIKKYKELKPDLVTMDITMPEMTGLEALQYIMEMDPKANIVMVSALGQDTLVKEAITHGAKSFILKPFKEEHVVLTLEKVLAI